MCRKLLIWIHLLFGKPCQDTGTLQAKFQRIGYWVSVVLIELTVIGSIVVSLVKVFIGEGLASLAIIPAAFVGQLVFPFMWRMVYSITLALNRLEKEK